MTNNDEESAGIQPVMQAYPNATMPIESIPYKVREIAILRGLGYTLLEIASRSSITPQAVSMMLKRYRRSTQCFDSSSELSQLSTRAANTLARLGITTKSDAQRCELFKELAQQRNCGSKTIQEIRQWVETGGRKQGPSAGSRQQHQS
ncbi:MAG: hypothetical protein IAE97_13625 [Chthoniobacterales bacterium]|nr:hypothetical protein [Chthoniobacterales bacterium]